MDTPEIDVEALKARYEEERAKRIRSDGAKQYVTPTGRFAHYLEDPHVEADAPRDPVRREVDVALVGAGFGGIQAAVALAKQGVDDFLLIDRAGDFGGVWYWNRYPGAACDTESYIYLPLLEETGYIPTEKYVRGPEIFAYARSLADKFDLYRRALLRTEITDLRWDDADGRWVLRSAQGDEIRARFVNLATGPLQRMKLPGIPGIETFQGHAFHSARWDYAYTGGDSTGGLTKLADKRVGIIGTGPTSVQAIPYLGRAAKQLYVFQRTPAPVPVRGNQPTDFDWARSQAPGWQMRRIENFNVIVSGGKQDEDLVADGWTELKTKVGIELDFADPETARQRQLADFELMEKLRRRIEDTVKDKATAEALKPWFNFGCKRPCFSDEYLETFNLPGVTLVDTQGRGVERVTETAVVAGGQAYEIDCLIYATGFDFNVGNAASRNGFEIHGRGGLTLTDKWARGGIATLHGYTMRGFPNLVIQANAQSAVTSNLTHSLGEGGRHFAYMVRHCLDRQARAFEPTEEAERAWAERVRSRTYRSRHDLECTPGYFNNDGMPGEGAGIAAFYPGSTQRLFQTLADWRAQGQMPGMEVA